MLNDVASNPVLAGPVNFVPSLAKIPGDPTTTEAKSIPLTYIPLTLPILAILFRPFRFIAPKTLN
jgi:hypothetical protein